MKPDHILTTRRDAQSEPDSGEEILRRIASAISGVRFGSVEVVIQDSRVVQISAKKNFASTSPVEGSRFDRNELSMDLREEHRTREGSGASC